MLIGRESECARLDELLDRAQLGRSGALVISGEPGIGKTALLEYAASRAESMTTVRTLGVESEAELEYSALIDVCRPLLAHLPEISDHHAEALRAALDLGPAVAVHRFAIGVATLSLLAAAAEVDPLLVLVDDAQWLDPSSAAALLFATRRLEADRAVVLIAVREGAGRELDTHGLDTLPLAGLGREAAAGLLQARFGVAAEVAERLHDATRGNPLALLELPELLSTEQLTGVVPLVDPLPAGSRVERAFAVRSSELPDESRRALLLAACSLAGAMQPLVAALESRGLGPAALDAAEDAGLVRIVEERLEFRHPLVRSAVYHAAAPSERRDAHRALADALVGKPDQALRAWHLAAATPTADEEVAALLESVAGRAQERSAHAEAAVALERAARLTPDASLRVKRFTDAAQAAWVVSDPDRALGLIAEASGGTSAAAERSKLVHLRGVIERRVGTHSLALELFLEAEALAAEDSPGAVANVLVSAVPTALWAGNVPAAVAMARRLHDVVPRDDATRSAIADGTLGWVLCLSGNFEEATPMLERAVGALLAPDEPTRFQLYSAGVGLNLLERTTEGDELLQRAGRMARTEGAPRAVLTALVALTPCDVRAGRWRLAAAQGEEGLALADELGHTDQPARIAVELARIDAARGEDDRCRQRVADCVRLADERGILTTGVTARAVLGILELSIGRLEDAIEQLELAVSEVERLGFYDRDTSPHPDLVEALVRIGRRSDARAVLTRYVERARVSTPLWGAALVARCRGMLAEDDGEATRHFEEAIALHARVEDRFQLGRTFLTYGERLRRSGRRRDARERLRASLGLFEELDATPWAARTQQELRASGERLRRREHGATEELTPQELQIALQVAEGKTNKEVGAALFLSHKTVEFHLSRIYRKLDLSSRAELIKRFVTERPMTALPR